MRSSRLFLRLALLGVSTAAVALGVGRAAVAVCSFPPRIVELANCRHADVSTDFIDGLACTWDMSANRCEPDDSVQTTCEGSYWTARVNGRCVDTTPGGSSWSQDAPRCEENYATRSISTYRFSAHCNRLLMMGWNCKCVPIFDDPPLSQSGDACECRDLMVSSTP